MSDWYGYPRRTVLKTLGTGVVLYGTGVGVASANGDEVSTLLLNNVNTSAWELTAAGEENAGLVGEENPTLTLLEGVRYEFENQGGRGAHPLEFRDGDGNALLSQDTQGAFEDAEAVDYDAEGNAMRFTVTPGLADALATYHCTLHSAMAGSIETDAADGPGLTFNNQTTASSTFTAEEPTTPGVQIRNVTADGEVAVVVTYEDGEDLVIAGLEVRDSPIDENVVVPIEDTGGFPGDHVAHLIPVEGLSADYEPGDTVSAETADSVLVNDRADAFQIDLTFEDQTASGPIAEGDVMGTVDVAVEGREPRLVVDIHPTDEDGSLVDDEFVGSTDVLLGSATDAEITAERVPEDGAFNELPFAGTDDFVAMVHLAVGTDSQPGDNASPGSFPVLSNVDADEGALFSGVTDLATITAEDDDADDDPADDDPADDDADDADDDGPGFGVSGALTALGSAGYLLKRRLNDEDSE